jgi:ABC-type transport system involved in multi-copper enzyme maturation permease subunit
MRFLTVAERELRTAAKRKGTQRARWITAALFLGLLLWLFWVFNAASRRGAGLEIFQACVALAFAYCLVVGTAVTADCVSSERREDTLGLLFLTNLNSAEIVAGKFCSTALSAVYRLVSIFPVLALPMLMGGVTLAHFWKTILALLVTIFFAMASGFVATSVCRRQFTAIAFALGLGILFGTGPMALAASLRALAPAASAGWADKLAAFCPLYTLVSAVGARVFGANEYWFSLLAVTGVAFSWMTFVTWRLARTWRDRPRARLLVDRFPFFKRWRGRGNAGQIALRRRLLDINPFFWLAGRKQISSPVFLGLAVVMAVVCSFVLAPWFGRVFGPGAGTVSPMIGHLFAWLWTGLALHLMTAYLAAMAASQRLAEDKQSGALELVLSTPTSERTIARGLWLAYGRRLFGPALLATLVHLFFIWQCLSTFLLEESGNYFRGATEWQIFWSALWDQPLNGRALEWHFGFMLRCGLLALALLMLAWVTLGWVGRWLGLRMKHPGFAPVVALACVFVPPALVFSLACYVADELGLDRLPERQFIPAMMWLAVAIVVGHYALLSGWARWHLRRDFRTIVMNRFQPASLRPWWRISRRALTRVAQGLAAMIALLALLVVGFYAYQNWIGQRRWAAFQREVKRQGGSLDFARLLPGPVPDDSNLARSPAFQAVLNRTNQAGPRVYHAALLMNSANLGTPNANIAWKWTSQDFLPLGYAAELLFQTNTPPSRTRFNRPTYRGPARDINRPDAAAGVVQGFRSHDEILDALAGAARLPFFQAFNNRTAVAVLRPVTRELQALEQVHCLFQLRACARLVGNDVAAAREDLLTCLRLANLARQSPDARSTARAQALLTASLQPLWEGLAQHQWTEPQLTAFQKELAGFNFLADYTNAVPRVVLAQIEIWRARTEARSRPLTMLQSRATAEAWVRARQPRAWWLAECIQLHQAGQRAIERMDVAAGRAGTGIDWNDLNGLSLDGDVHNLLQQQNWGANAASVAFSQNAVNQAIIACALERHLLAHGKYPDKLEDLRPAYLEEIPSDPMRGRPMIYQRTDDRHYILRSVGPNEVDDRKNPSSDDWLWSFPTNAPAIK